MFRFVKGVDGVSDGGDGGTEFRTPSGRLEALLAVANRLYVEIHASEKVSAKLVEAFLKTVQSIRDELSVMEQTSTTDVDELIRSLVG